MYVSPFRLVSTNDQRFAFYGIIPIFIFQLTLIGISVLDLKHTDAQPLDSPDSRLFKPGRAFGAYELPVYDEVKEVGKGGTVRTTIHKVEA